MEIKVKEWIVDKAQETASNYNIHIDFERQENGMRKVEDGFITICAVEVLAETEKAIQIVAQTGSVVGSAKGWKMWIPKSQLA